MLQGDLIISEQNFVKQFPSASGYRAFLIDAEDPQATEEELSFALEDYGLELTRHAAAGGIQSGAKHVPRYFPSPGRIGIAGQCRPRRGGAA